MSEAASATDKPVSVAKLIEESELDEDMIPILFEAFMEETPTILEEVQAAVAAREGEKLRSSAHKLKGTCNSIKAEPLLMLSKKLEYTGINGDWNVAENLLPHVESEFARVVKFIENFG